MKRWTFGACIVLGVFTLISRAAVITVMPIDPTATRAGDEIYYYQIATTLLEEGTYQEGRLRAYRPPGYPAFVALTLATFKSAVGVQILQNLMLVAAAAGMAIAVGRRHSAFAGILTAAIALTLPTWLVIPQQMVSETLFIGLILIALLIATRHPEKHHWVSFCIVGFSIGAAALTREIGLFLGGAIVTVVSLRVWMMGHRRLAGLLSGSALLVAMLVILPWTIRNYRVFHALVPISTNGPINLYMGNNPDATGNFRWALPGTTQQRWNRRDATPAEELAISRAAKQAALAHAFQHPVFTLRLAVKKAWILWRPPPWSYTGINPRTMLFTARWIHWLAFTLLAGYGLWLLRHDQIAQAIVAMIVIGTAIHMATVAGDRYSSPYEFLLAIPAGIGGTDVIKRIWRQRIRGRQQSPAPSTANP